MALLCVFKNNLIIKLILKLIKLILKLLRLNNWEGDASSLAHTWLKLSQVTKNGKLD